MRVLLIEDNPGDAELVRKALAANRDGPTIESNVRLQDALDRADLREFDVILADLSLPDSTGLQSVRALRAAVPDTPVVVLTSLTNDSVAESAIEDGAQDYLVKDRIDGDRLARSIRYAVQRQRAATENQSLVRSLRESKELLEKQNRRLESVCDTAQQFVDNVSHEFRTPLTVIMEYASLLRDGVVGEVNDEQQRLLDVIDDRVCDLNTMVDDMLDVSKLEAGLLGAWRAECRVGEIVEHVLPSLQRKAEVRGVSFETAVPDDLPLIYCDAEKAGRVLINLVINAIKFCGEPGVVRVWAEEANESEVEIFISDNGPGIPPERMQEMFERFAQLQTELKQSTKGFGLGLNIAQELTSLNFGRLSVQDRPGGGSIFSFTLPKANPTEVTSRYLERIGAIDHDPQAVSVLELTAVGADPMAARDVQILANSVLRQNDLIFRRTESDWLLLVATPGLEVHAFLERLHASHAEFSRNRPKGPLPPISCEVQGSWHVIDDADRILSYIETRFIECEACHVEA